ncbi:DctP family TRAP transporter solute-binding subunit [Cupriavidus sp. WGlv3]|uniref:DctP family TRAP transporter solute-binding subunit n=1 Tax=Cupriavidus sp. WGlv3 TaxID=2919924 RepID=UPI0020904D32|nr:DctP family TRAP transporter solute-binding subunit [Cupriavidus sp. WGlv3]MCO4860865.1 DctP family TRAP transporter solute-binding subunit [Cupriavidus sp. WGlv3]
MKHVIPHIVLAALLSVAGVAQAHAQAPAPVKLRFAHTVPETDSQHQAALAFSKKVRERTQGGVEIQVFANSQLGNDTTLVTGVRSGTIDIGATGNPFVTGLAPRLNVLDLPYQFEDGPSAYKVLDGPVGRSLLEELGAHRIKGLAFWEIGFRSLGNNKRPVNKAEDIRGLKIRTTPNPSHIKAFQLLGASPQPMPFAEVFGALESGAVDGQENPPTLMVSAKMYEVQKYVSMTRHAYTALVVLMNKAKFDALRPEYQKVLLEEAAAAATYQRKLNADNEAAAIATLRARGVQVNEHPDNAGIRKVVREETRQLFVQKNGDAVLRAMDAQR